MWHFGTGTQMFNGYTHQGRFLLFLYTTAHKHTLLMLAYIFYARFKWTLSALNMHTQSQTYTHIDMHYNIFNYTLRLGGI